MRALTYDSNTPEEMLTHPGRIFNDCNNSTGGFEVAYDFAVDLDGDGNVVAKGACYEQVLAQADITVRLNDLRARDAVARGIQGED